MGIDILMATYNGEKYLAEQIESIRAQTYQDWRLLVSDDCSTDATLDILRRYEQEDHRIRIISEGVRHGGAKENFWSLLSRTDAPFAMLCDQDDVWHPDKIEKTFAEMRRMEQRYGTNVPLLVFTDLNIVDANLRIMSDSFMRHEEYYPPQFEFEKLVFRNVAPGCTMLFNRALIERAFVPEDSDCIEMHDWWLMLVASATGYINYLDEPTIDYRQHEHNTIGIRERTGFRFPNMDNALEKAIITRKRTAVLLNNLSSDTHNGDRERMIDYQKSGRGGIKGLRLLVKSGFWDRTLRKRFGQIYATVFRLNKSLYENNILGRPRKNEALSNLEIKADRA